MENIKKLSPLDNKYLQITECIDNNPKEYYILGNLPTERKISVAVVGTRKPTAYGREVTEAIVNSLVARGVVIISGLALGIDALAHKTALDLNGTTIAVQANGLDRIYPSTNRQLAKNILDSGGAIISEYPPGTAPMQHRFLERNRIVSGLADAILVTEASARSGTLNTVSHGLAQGKTIFVVPGNITSPMSAGCNQLLRQGAIPITSPSDVLEALFPDEKGAQSLLPIGATPLENDILKLLHDGVRDGDILAEKLAVPASELNTALTMLEINGAIKSLGMNQWRLG